jgi:hypothetical protein
MKIGETHETQSSSFISANTIGTPISPAPIVMVDQTRKKQIIGALCLVSIAYWQGHNMRQYIGAPMPPAPIYWRTELKKCT